MSITAELSFFVDSMKKFWRIINILKLFYAGKCLFLIRHIPQGTFYSLSVTPGFIQMSQSYTRWNHDLNWTKSDVHTHPLELNSYLEKKRYLYLSLKAGGKWALTLVRTAGLGDSCWPDKTISMKLVHKVLLPDAISFNDNNDTKKPLFFSRKIMETVEIHYSKKKKKVCFVQGLANDGTFVQMKLGTGKKMSFISFTVTWK